MKAILETIMRATGKNNDLLARWMRDEAMQRHLREHPGDSLVGYKNGREVTKGATTVCLRTKGSTWEDSLPHPDDLHLGPAHIEDGGLVVFGDQAGLFLKSRRVKALTVVINDLVEVDEETIADLQFYPASLWKTGAVPVLYGCGRARAVFPSLVGLSGSGDLSWYADDGYLSSGFSPNGISCTIRPVF